MDPEKIERSYARTGHYDGINRTNLEVITDSKVTKILLDDGVATGVLFEQKTENSTAVVAVKADKEVIIAAGAIHSPQILQQSGIGPRALLESAGIDTVVDLPGVGQNFQDHPMVFTSITRKSLCFCSKIQVTCIDTIDFRQCRISASIRTQQTCT